MDTVKKLIIQGIVGLLTIFAITFGRLRDMPDNFQRLHGLPFIWGTHQLNTIAGPVDIWYINLTNLSLDIFLWLLFLIIAPILYDKFTIVSCPRCIE